MILVDSGYLIALAKPKDDLHPKAVSWSRHIHEPLLVSEYVLWAVVNYLSLVHDRIKVHTLVEQVMNESTFVFLAASTELRDAGLQTQDALSSLVSEACCLQLATLESQKL